MKSKRILCCIFVIAAVLILSVFPASAEELPETQNPEIFEAAAVLREGLKNREMLIDVSFTTDLDSFDGTSVSAKELANRIMELAYAHTGVPDEGDYLRFSLWHIEPSSVNFTQLADGWQFSFTYYAVYFTTAEQEAELDAEIAALVESLGLKSDLTDYQKISGIYNYICSNIVYDYEHLEDTTYGLQWSAYAAVVNKTAVCQGYATLFYRLALESGIDRNQ